MLFNDGDRLLTEGKVAEACEAFEASNTIEPRAGTLVRLGQCREQNQQLASAWSAYKDALTRVKDPAKRKFATARIAELEPKLSTLTITVADANRTDGLVIARNDKPTDQALWNRAVPVDGGTYTIAVTAPGHESWKTTATVPVERGTITVDIPRLERSPLPVTRPGTEVPPPTLTKRRKLAIRLAVVSGASFVTGGVLGLFAQSKENSAFERCPDPQAPCLEAGPARDLTVSGHRLAIGANVMFGIAGVAAIGAGFLWITGAPESPRRVALVPSPSGIQVVGRF